MHIISRILKIIIIVLTVTRKGTLLTVTKRDAIFPTYQPIDINTKKKHTWVSGHKLIGIALNCLNLERNEFIPYASHTPPQGKDSLF